MHGCILVKVTTGTHYHIHVTLMTFLWSWV